MVTEPLPSKEMRDTLRSRCLATIRNTHTDTQTDGRGFMKYAVEMDSAAIIYTYQVTGKLIGGA
jgi:hypothetical protein